MQNTNPERKSLSELVKAIGDGKIILVDDSYDIAKHIELIEKIRLKHEVVIVRIDDLLVEDEQRVREMLAAENNRKAFGGGLAEMLQESMDKLIKDMHRLELEAPPLDEKPVHQPAKIHDFGQKRQEKQFNSFKPLPKKVLGFRGKR